MILLLGGTSDSLKIAEILNEIGAGYILSVVSEYGTDLASKVAECVVTGRLDSIQMAKLTAEKRVSFLIDATHPFAVEASKTAMQVCCENQIKYLRFERPSKIPEEAVTASSIAEACSIALRCEGQIYLTTGSKELAKFLAYLPVERCIARVLPVSAVLEKVEALGFLPHQIEAIKGPFSKEMNAALLERNRAGVMIAKESGEAGGLLEKVSACSKIGIPCLVIRREKISYPEKYEDIAALMQAVTGLEEM